MKIAVELIHPNEGQVRKSWEPEGIDELAKSIKSEGLVCPIKVKPTGNSHYEIVYGHRRYAAAMVAGLTEIEAIVEEADAIQQLTRSMIENMVREDMNDADVSDGLIALKKMNGYTWERIGAMFGKSESWAKALGSLAQKEKELIRVHCNVLTYTHIQQVRAGIKEEKYQLLVLDKVGREKLQIQQARIVAENVEKALQWGGEREAMEELRRPYLESFQPKATKEDKQEEMESFSWFKDKEVTSAINVFQNFNNTITRLMTSDTDRETARKILTQFKTHLSTFLARIPAE
jgi:ParB family transcriptional regulator, chromosome partitioning protein